MTDKPRLLDLFCGAGGAARGYQLAGFHVTGVDIKPQPRYAGDHFCQADIMDVGLPALLRELGPFDAIHASPPCQDHSQLHRNYGASSHGTAWMLEATLAALHAQERPWVVENVVGAPLPSAIELCGASFGLGASGLDLNRHRRFQMSFYVLAPPCQHRPGHTIGVYGNGTNRWHREKLGRNLSIAEQREAMGIDWMPRADLAQAIPPAYTQWIGRQLLGEHGGVMPNAEPAENHRCQVCRQMKAGCARSVYPPEPAHWTCPSCLEAAGQLTLAPE